MVVECALKDLPSVSALSLWLANSYISEQTCDKSLSFEPLPRSTVCIHVDVRFYPQLGDLKQIVTVCCKLENIHQQSCLHSVNQCSVITVYTKWRDKCYSFSCSSISYHPIIKKTAFISILNSLKYEWVYPAFA